MKHIIFEDDFSQDTIGQSPSKWKILEIGDFDTKLYFSLVHIQKEGNGKEIVVARNYQPRIAPTGFPDDYLPDSFTLEFDFFLDHVENQLAGVEFNLMPGDDYGRNDFDISFDGKLWLWDSISQYGYNNKYYPGHFDYDFWHHYTIYYNQGRIKWYVDQHCVYEKAKINFIPHRFNLWLCGLAKMRNFRLATGMPQYEFERLEIEKKLVTHAINFDVAKSTVKQESLAFIKQLAQYLITHPAMKLEIDGHTDNDGTMVSNEKLSFARASEVKRQLVMANVSANRLTVKGFGSSKPLKKGNDNGYKAENRRVEFIVE